MLAETKHIFCFVSFKNTTRNKLQSISSHVTSQEVLHQGV